MEEYPRDASSIASVILCVQYSMACVATIVGTRVKPPSHTSSRCLSPAFAQTVVESFGCAEHSPQLVAFSIP